MISCQYDEKQGRQILRYQIGKHTKDQKLPKFQRDKKIHLQQPTYPKSLHT